MIFLYAARAAFDRYSENPPSVWDSYISWSKLTHLDEVVSLDSSLNQDLVQPDYNNADDWQCFHDVDMIEAGLTTKENYELQTGKTYDPHSNMVATGLYTSLAYVLKRAEKKDRFNLLTVAINPEKDCRDITLDGYTFMGYDLLDQYYEKSALTNCGGHDETFLPEELNKYGLIDEYEKALDIKHRLFENNPEEGHAKTNLIAIWRHNTIGRKLTWRIVGRKIFRILFPETWG